MRRLGRALALFVLADCSRAEREPAPSPPVSPAVSIAVDRPSSPQAPPEKQATPQAPPEKHPRGARFAVIGDFGTGAPSEANVAAMVKSWRPDFVMTLGDNNYPTGDAASIDTNIGQFYAEFIGNYRGRFGPGSPSNRFWPSPGNHDWISGLSPYLEYFTLPGNERYYDVDLGLVHLYAVDSDAHEPDGNTVDSAQAAWLKARLAASTSCYDLVYFHHPAYSTSEHGPELSMRWPFREWGAEAVLAGHDHTYERFTVDGIPYFVNGLGGASRYEFPMPRPAEGKFRFNDDYGAMRVTATPAEITYEFFSVDGKKRDTLTVPGKCRD